ncbi:hypothetical protein O0L34_g112 [Tuta absoluta]|nr:hypothetical protein O0L34_g112 [Tuta absoluta]
MAFSPRVIFSKTSKEKCVANLKELPKFVRTTGKQYSSVLVPMCVINDEVHLLYTKRSMNLKNHSGQVSFPGGKMDGNETVTETALRETEEEIGVPSQDVDIWGQMPMVQGRNLDMLITPVVGVINNFDFNKLVPNDQEVEEIFTVPLSALSNPENHAHLEYKPPLPIFLHGKHKIWGITGLITHMFLQSLLPEETYIHKVDFMRKMFTLDECMPLKPQAQL